MSLLWSSLAAFHANAANSIVYNFSTNWWLILFAAATALCVFLGVKEESQNVVREEQNIL